MIIGTPIQGAKGVKTEVSRSSGDEHILHLSLRLKRAIFILRKVKGEVEYLVVGDTLYLVNPVGDLEPKVGI